MQIHIDITPSAPVVDEVKQNLGFASHAHIIDPFVKWKINSQNAQLVYLMKKNSLFMSLNLNLR